MPGFDRDIVRLPAGVPLTQLEEVEGPMVEGAMLAPDGRRWYRMPTLCVVGDPAAYAAALLFWAQSTRPACAPRASLFAFLSHRQPPLSLIRNPQQSKEVLGMLEAAPSELLCPLCHKEFRDAVKVPCCGVTFCDDCTSFCLGTGGLGFWI